MNPTNEFKRRLVERLLPERAVDFLKDLRIKALPFMPRYSFAFPHSTDEAQHSPFPFIVDRDNPLENLGDKYQPTKRLHNYLVYYWMHFRDIRAHVRNVLEIGVQTDRSIRMWEEFFPNAIIHGLDIDRECRQLEGGRRRIWIGDQSDYGFLDEVTQQAGGPFDVIIDDGSHKAPHQLRTFDFLFPRMSNHGIYVVEDTGGCVGDHALRTVNALKALVDDIMYWPSGFEPRNWPHLSKFPEEAGWSARNVVGIAFYRWIVFVMRGENPQDNPFLTPMTS